MYFNEQKSYKIGHLLYQTPYEIHSIRKDNHKDDFWKFNNLFKQKLLNL